MVRVEARTRNRIQSFGGQSMRSGGFKDKARRAWKAAELLCRLAKVKDKLRHGEAVRAIKEKFGKEFLYTNRNGNPAISEGVLEIFELFTADDLVWSKHGRFWRRRRPDDPKDARVTRY